MQYSVFITSGFTGGRVQQQAVTCLQELAEASNGIGESAVATHSEIDRLLFALQHSSPQVRDAAQRVSAQRVE